MRWAQSPLSPVCPGWWVFSPLQGGVRDKPSLGLHMRGLSLGESSGAWGMSGCGSAQKPAERFVLFACYGLKKKLRVRKSQNSFIKAGFLRTSSAVHELCVFNSVWVCVSSCMLHITMPRTLARGTCNISNLKLQWLTFIALFKSLLPSKLPVFQFVPLTDKYFISSCGSLCHGCLIALRVSSMWSGENGDLVGQRGFLNYKSLLLMMMQKQIPNNSLRSLFSPIKWKVLASWAQPLGTKF